MVKVQKNGLVLYLPFGKVEVNNIILASKTLSRQEMQKLSVDEILRKRLHQIAERAETLSGFRSVLESGGDVLLRRDLSWQKPWATVRSHLSI
jgi:hypothetical protein